MKPILKTQLRLLAVAPVALGLSVHAATIVEVNFNHLSLGTIGDGVRIQDVSGNGYHGFWGQTNGKVPVVGTPTGIGVDTSGDRTGKVFLRHELTGIPDAWDGGTTSRTDYFTLDLTQSYTFEAVVNWNGTTNAVNGLMGKASSADQFWMRESGGNLHYAFGKEGTKAVNMFSATIDISAAKADMGWHGIAVVYDALNHEVRSYLDGNLLHTQSHANVGSLGTTTTDGDFFLGAYNTFTNNQFDGIQDRYRISSGVLDPSDFLAIPEPSALLLSGLGALALLHRRRG